MFTTAALVIILALTVWTLYQVYALRVRVEAIARQVVSAEETLIDVHKVMIALDRDLRE